MLVATPAQTTAYSTLHNSSTGSAGGGGSGVGTNNANTTVTNKKTTTTSLNLNASTASSGTPKSLNNNNNHTSSTGTNKTSLNSNNTHTVTYNYQQNSSKSDNNVSTTKYNNSTNNINKTSTATSSRDKIMSIITPAKVTSHSLKNEISTTITTTTTSSNKQSFIQTLKDSVQKALISTTGRNSISNNKTNNNCNNATTTSIQNITSSSSTTTTSNNTNKVSTTTTSSTTSSNSTSTAATQSSSSSSSLPLGRSKYFSCSLSKLHTVAPTIIHRYPEDRQHASSTDSLQKEMCHFKPIRVAPTTPWKTGSKSRGSSLRFPKANLATKKTEFILKSNCDVNSKKKKQQTIRTQVENKQHGRGDEDNNEQENKEFYGIYKPKPSLTCLPTPFNTPNHQSAFVCLVTEMKNLVDMQSKKLISPAKSPRSIAGSSALNTGQTKAKITRSARGTILAATSTTISSYTPMEDKVKELFIRQKEKPVKKSAQTKKTESAKQLPTKRSTRLASNAVVKNKSYSTTTTTIKSKSKENVKQTNAKTSEISKLSKVSSTKAKSRRKVDDANLKSKMVNIVAMRNSTKAKEKVQKAKSDTIAAVAISVAPVKKTRKRKAHTIETVNAEDIAPSSLSSSPIPLPLTSTASSAKTLLRARKQKQTSAVPLKKHKSNSGTSLACFSPPLTRARLKSLEAQGKTIATAMTETKKRRI